MSSSPNTGRPNSPRQQRTSISADEPRKPKEDQRDTALAGVERVYDAYASSGYGTRWNSLPGGMRHVVAERDAWLAEVLVDRPTILDLGCGNANLALTLERANGRPIRYVGVDLREDRIDLARSRVPWAEFYVGSADRLDLEAASVDAVAAVTLFSSLPYQWLREAVAAEIERVLRPGGRLALYDIRYPSPRNRAVVAVGLEELARLFPGWTRSSHAMALLPPLARSPFAASARAYRCLSLLAPLRSHLGVTLDAPGRSGAIP